MIMEQTIDYLGVYYGQTISFEETKKKKEET